MGSVMKTVPPGPTISAHTPDNVERVRQAMLRSPGRSARRHSAELGLSNRTVRRIFHKYLGYHPYKLAIVQEVNENDYPKHLEFAQTMLNIFEEHEDLLVVMSDEVHFHLNGTVNKQNCRYWASENPRGLHERPLHSPKVTVWCSIGKCSIIGPFFFEENGIMVTVTSAHYIGMLNHFLIPELQRRRINQRNLWF
jgi:hypothetical protein